MQCINHLDNQATGACNHCGKSLCPQCQVQIKGEIYCKDCVAVKLGQEKKEERSPALAAILSFIIAGLGQIYNGQVGKGVLILFTSWLIIPWIIGIVDAYNTANKINRGEIVTQKRTGCLIAVIISVVIFWISIFFLALLAAIAIPNLLRAKANASDAAARAAVAAISTAIETYAAQNNNIYPTDEAALTNTHPPYLSVSYNNKTMYGHVFKEEFQPNGYKITVVPEKCGLSGNKIFTVETGGKISENKCVLSNANDEYFE